MECLIGGGWLWTGVHGFFWFDFGFLRLKLNWVSVSAVKIALFLEQRICWV